MMRLAVQLLVMILLAGSLNDAFADGEQLLIRRSRRLANNLIFYFASPEQTITKEQLDKLMRDPTSPTSKIYGRILKEREEIESKIEYIKKNEWNDPKKINRFHQVQRTDDEDSKEVILFESAEIREAALQVLLEEAYQEAIPMIHKALYSAREEMQVGTIMAMNSMRREEFLQLYEKVLFTDPDQGRQFPEKCRRIATLGLRKYLDNPKGKALFHRALRDSSYGVRFNAIDGMEPDIEGAEFVEGELLSRANDLLKKLNKESRKQDNRILSYEQRIRPDMPSVQIDLSKQLEWLVKRDPELLKKLEFGDAWKELSIARILLAKPENSEREAPVQYLAPELRKRILSYYLDLSNGDLSSAIRALKRLNDGDREEFSPMIASLLQQSRNTQILTQCLHWVREWKISESKKVVAQLASEDYRTTLRQKAGEVLESL